MPLRLRSRHVVDSAPGNVLMHSGAGGGVSAPARGWGPVAQHRGGGEGRSVPSTGGGSALAQEIGRGSAIWTVEEEEFLAPGGEG